MSDIVNALAISSEEATGTRSTDGATGTEQPAAARFSNPIWQLGYTDGRVGVPEKTIRELVEHLETSVKEVSGADGQAPTPGTPEEQESRHSEEIRSVHRDSEIRHARAPYDGHRGVAVAEVTFGLILLAGDIGLNWSILGDVFQLLQDTTMRAFLCGGLMAIAGIAWPFFEECVFSPHPHRKRIVTTAVLLCLMITTAAVISTLRANHLDDSRAIDQAWGQKKDATAPPPVIKPDIMLGLAYGVMCLSFAVFSGYFFASGVHRLSQSERIKNSKSAESNSRLAPSARTTGDGARMRVVVRPLEISAKDAIKSLYLIYRHGFERGARLRWTLTEGESPYAHCLRVVRNRTITTNYEEPAASDIPTV